MYVRVCVQREQTIVEIIYFTFQQLSPIDCCYGMVVFEQAKAGKVEGTLDSRTLGDIRKHISNKVSLRGSCFRSVIVSGFDVRFSKS